MGKILGVEIGSDTLKIALCVNGSVTKMATKRLRHGSVLDGRISSTADVASTLKEAMKENGIRCQNAAVVLPTNIMIGRNISMPLMTESEYELNLPFEFKDFVGRESDKYYYDYIIKSVNGNIAELYACAVQKKDIDVYYELFRKAGLKLKSAIPAEIAWQNLIRTAKNEPSNLCIVDIGYNTTTVNIYSGGFFAMGRDIEYGGRNLDEALGKYLDMDDFAARTRKETNLNNCLAADACTDVYAEIATEVARILKYYNDVHSGSQVQDIYYCGSSAQIEALRTAISRYNDMTPHHISRIVPGATEKDDLTLCCAISAGAAV